MPVPAVCNSCPHDATYADCPEWLLGAESCDEYASGIADAFADINNGSIGIIPYQVDVAVNSASWFNRWLGIYPASTYKQADAGDGSGSMIPDNRDLYAGNFLSGAIGAVAPRPWTRSPPGATSCACGCRRSWPSKWASACGPTECPRSAWTC